MVYIILGNSTDNEVEKLFKNKKYQFFNYIISFVAFSIECITLIYFKKMASNLQKLLSINNQN